jgi:hypothetical protein
MERSERLKLLKDVLDYILDSEHNHYLESLVDGEPNTNHAYYKALRIKLNMGEYA